MRTNALCQSQHLGNSARYIAQIAVVDAAHEALQTHFVYHPDLLCSHLGTLPGGRRLDQQGKTGLLNGARQRNNDDSSASLIDFVGRQNDAWAGFGHFSAPYRIKLDPKYVASSAVLCHDLRCFAASAAILAACAMANSRSKTSRSKSSSSSSVRTASTHSCPSRAKSGSRASRAFIASQAATNSASSFSSSRRNKSTKNWLRLRGATARAKRVATSSGRRNNTCLGAGV